MASWSPSTIEPQPFVARAASRNLSFDYGKISPISKPHYPQSLKSNSPSTVRFEDRRENQLNTEIDRKIPATTVMQQDFRLQEQLTQLEMHYKQKEENYLRQIEELQSKAATPRTTRKSEPEQPSIDSVKKPISQSDKENIGRPLDGPAKKPMRSASNERVRRSRTSIARTKSPLRSQSPSREARDLELKKATLETELKELSQKKSKLTRLNKEAVGLKSYYEQRCNDLTAELTLWKDKTSDLATKHYSALRTIRKTQHELKIEAIRNYKALKSEWTTSVTELKGHYDLEISKLKERIDRAEKRRPSHRS